MAALWGPVLCAVAMQTSGCINNDLVASSTATPSFGRGNSLISRLRGIRRRGATVMPVATTRKPSRFAESRTIHCSSSMSSDNNGSTTSDEIANRSKKATRKVNTVNSDLDGKLGAILSNAKRLNIRGYSLRCSLGIDLGDVKTGIAASRGHAPRPISVVNFRGEKLEAHLLQVADREKADEFILGLPKSVDGKETHQSNKVRSFAGRLAARAAERGWRVYLQDEYGTSEDALNYMIDMGSTKRCRKEQLDAYAAVVLLQMYFNSAGRLAEFIVPKNTALQQLLCEGSMKILYLEDEFDGADDNLLAEV